MLVTLFASTAIDCHMEFTKFLQILLDTGDERQTEWEFVEHFQRFSPTSKMSFRNIQIWYLLQQLLRLRSNNCLVIFAYKAAALWVLNNIFEDFEDLKISLHVNHLGLTPLEFISILREYFAGNLQSFLFLPLIGKHVGIYMWFFLHLNC